MYVLYPCECSLSSHEWPCVCYLWVHCIVMNKCATLCMSALPCVFIVWSCVTLCVRVCIIPCECSLSDHVWSCVCMSALPCGCSLSYPVCAWVYYHVSVIVWSCVTLCVLYPVSVHCVIMCDPVCAWVYYHVSVHCLVMNDPVCPWVHYHVSMHCLVMNDPVCAWVYYYVSVHCLVMNDPVWHCTCVCITLWALSDHEYKPCVFLQVCITLCPSRGCEWPCMYFPSECSSHGHEWPYMILGVHLCITRFTVCSFVYIAWLLHGCSWCVHCVTVCVCRYVCHSAPRRTMCTWRAWPWRVSTGRRHVKNSSVKQAWTLWPQLWVALYSSPIINETYISSLYSPQYVINET